MGRCRVVTPDVVRIPISDGDWIEVKKRLTWGEKNRMMSALVSEVRADGRITPNMEMAELAQVMAYLVDWSLLDLKGKPITLGTDDAKKRAAIEAQDEDTIKEITDAITKHVAAMDAQRSAEKNAPAGESASSATSSSAA